ncbi:MAG TPA: hypothetical protein G4N96_14975 [Chloroflexi bacterium]|nr:hypothetical protein [Chloroflexota bacterium]
MSNQSPGNPNSMPKPSFSTPQYTTEPERKRKNWLWLGVGGLGLLACVAAVIASGLIIYNRSQNDEAAQGNNPALPTIVIRTAMPLDGETAVALASVTPTLTARHKISQTQPITVADAVSVANEPEFGPICFKPVTLNGDMLACNGTFPPTTVEVHAIFEYANMTPDRDKWARVWYHNGSEVLRVKEDWTGDVAGQFDYNLNTSDKQPLSDGTWELELYANGQLQTYGAFIIQAAQAVTNTPVLPTPTSAPAPLPIASYKLAFTKWDGSRHSVWTADLDGGNQRFLLDFSASPSWSPDGSQLTFYGEEGIDTQAAVSGGTNGVWIMGASGENPRRILPEGTGHAVDWSPVGNLIAFSAARGGPDRRIYFVYPDGNPAPFEILGEQPSFSPDGKQVVVKACRPDCGLWIVNADDTNPRRLTDGGTDGLPAFSPDGRKIAFSRNIDDNVDVYVVNANGSGLRQLTTAPGNDSVPAWTPDGRGIVFRSTRNGVWQIYLMNADGSNQHLIIDKVGAGDEWAFDKMSVK